MCTHALAHHGIKGLKWGVRRYLDKHQVTFNGKRISIGGDTVRAVADLARKGRDLMGYIY